MLYDVLRFVTYLSIFTATSSSYLAKETLVNYRRASPSSIPNDQLTELSYNDGEGLDWTDLNVEPSQPDFSMPQLVNAKSMLYTQLSSSSSNVKNQKRVNNRKLNNRMRGKKDNNKLVTSKNNIKLTNLIKSYDNMNKRNNIDNSVRSESNIDKNVSEKVQTLENDNKTNYTTNKNDELPQNQNSHYQPSPAISNEFPNSQLSSENEQNRELQQLFGIEAAKKFQTYQLQQQLLNKNKDYNLKPDDEGVEIKEPQRKRNDDLNVEEVQDVQGAMANPLMPRTTRRQREYDVPLIQCPPATDGMERFACPTPDRQGRYRCIDDHVLCDGFIDCPEGADEDRQACMFYKTTKAHLDVLADALLRWARGR